MMEGAGSWMEEQRGNVRAQAPPTLSVGKSASNSGVTAGANMPPMQKLRVHSRVRDRWWNGGDND